MTTDKKSLSFGRYLQAIRLEKDISLETVSKETRIRIENLLYIEEEDHDRLPDEAFVRGFLRAFAKAIGADEDEAIRRYELRLKVVRKIIKSENDLKISSQKFWQRLLISMGILLCIIVLSVYGLSVLWERHSHVDTMKTNKEHREVKENRSKTALEPQYDTGTVKAEVNEKPEMFILKIMAVEETWMKISMDGKDPSEYNLKPGDQVELKAISGYNLLIGNAGGVKLLLNDENVDVPGNVGQVVNITIP